MRAHQAPQEIPHGTRCRRILDQCWRARWRSTHGLGAPDHQVGRPLARFSRLEILDIRSSSTSLATTAIGRRHHQWHLQRDAHSKRFSIAETVESWRRTSTSLARRKPTTITPSAGARDGHHIQWTKQVASHWAALEMAPSSTGPRDQGEGQDPLPVSPCDRRGADDPRGGWSPEPSW